MIVVTNKIKTKPGFAEKMAPAFTRPGALQKMKGFVKVEVLIRKNVTEHDELNVNTYWENSEDFSAWKNSDAFKEAHKRPEPSSEETPKESPILGSEIIIAEVAAVLEATPQS
jgi:heme oxygenase (staphylobilin-producing)